MTMSQLPSQEFRTVRGYELKKQKESRLTPALEDYLEMAYRLCLEEKCTRINRLSGRLHVRPSSASKMVSKLVQLGYLRYDSFENVLLTEEGRITGDYLLQRHNTLERFFTMLRSPRPLEEAELVEHMLGDLTVLEIKVLMEFFIQNPDIEKQFKNFRDMVNLPNE
jgi:Mn-dependent DtxR family transcriptional regulator